MVHLPSYEQVHTSILTFRVTPSSQYPPSGFAGHLLINKEAYPIPILTVRILSLTTAADPSLALVLLSKSSKSLDHMLRKEYTVYCFEILWIGHMLRYHTDGFSESPTTVSLLLCWSVRYRLTVYVERVYKRKEPCGSIQYQKSYGRL